MAAVAFLPSHPWSYELAAYLVSEIVHSCVSVAAAAAAAVFALVFYG